MRRVQRSQDKEHIVEALTKSELSPFKEIWRLLLFCAALGIKEGRREPLGSVDSGKAMPQSYFNSNPAWPGYQYLLALVVKNDPSILTGSEEADNERVAIFEEYANGGLSILAQRLESSSYSLDSLVALISQSFAEALPTDEKVNSVEF